MLGPGGTVLSSAHGRRARSANQRGCAGGRLQNVRRVSRPPSWDRCQDVNLRVAYFGQYPGVGTGLFRPSRRPDVN